MEKIGFIGACDKSSLIMYVAKLLEYSEKRVLVVDTTILQKMKYIVPSVNPTKSYITDFERIDFAIGFQNMREIMNYIGLSNEKTEDKMPYDYVLIDVDSEKMLENFEIQYTALNYFVTSFELYSLRKGIEIFSGIEQPMKLSKILYDYKTTREDEEYLEYLSLGTKIIWKDFSVYLHKNGSDNQMIEDNQRGQRIRIKRLSSEFQEVLCYIAQEILDEKNITRIKKTIKA